MEFTSLLDTVKNLIPSNPVASFVNGDMLQVLVFAIIIGIVCLSLKEKAEPFVKVVDSVNEISMKIISFVMYFTPIGVFSSIAIVIQSNGIDTVISLGGVLLALYITYILYVVFIYGGLVKFVGKVPVKEFFKKVSPAALNAFGTCSSSATIPLSKKAADDQGVPNEISSLAIPLGATINMDAVSILIGCTDVTDLQYTTNLSEVCLNNNEISDISPPAGLSELYILHLDDGNVNDIELLQKSTAVGNESNSGGKECPVCKGSRKCPKCGGSMWVREYRTEYKYINGFPELVTET